MRKKGLGLSTVLPALALTAALIFGSAIGASAADKVKIGLMFGLTGAASPIGPVQLDGAKLAIKEINAKGGVNLGGKRLPIETFVKDDESKPDIAIRRYREMLDENKVDAIVGQTFAPISAALNKEVKKSNIAYFALCLKVLMMQKCKQKTMMKILFYFVLSIALG